MLDVLFLRLLHCILALGSVLGQWIQRFPKNLKLLYSKRSAFRTIQSDARNLKKLPLHLGMVILEDHLSYTDIANLIVWSAALGISYISLYDIHGECKQNNSLLNEEVIKRKKDILEDEFDKYDIQMHCSGRSCKELKASTRLTSAEVYLLSPDDGRQSLVQRARELCHLVSSKQQKIEDITPFTVDKLMQDYYGFPDPDVVLKFGPVESLLGYMPWHIRLTEIISVSSHIGLDYQSFLSSVKTYGHTELRFGK